MCYGLDSGSAVNTIRLPAGSLSRGDCVHAIAPVHYSWSAYRLWDDVDTWFRTY